MTVVAFHVYRVSTKVWFWGSYNSGSGLRICSLWTVLFDIGALDWIWWSSSIIRWWFVLLSLFLVKETGKNEKFRMTNLEWGVDFFRLDKFSQYFLRWTNLDSCFKKLTFLE